MNIYIDTYGCTFNQGDSEIMAGLLIEEGYGLVNTPEDADVIVINTCYVKLPTEQKVINRILKLKQEFPHKKLIISGCMVEIDQEKLKKLAPEAGWIGPHQINYTPQAVESVLKNKTVRFIGAGDLNKVCLPKIRSNRLIHIIQICEGCNGLCSYCCTRIARGNLHSYSVELIRKEVEKAIADGCVEIQLTAQDTAAYGKDINTSLSELINSVTGVEGNYRVRVGMMHPKSVINNLDGLIQAFKSEKVYKFIHLPLQSGNNDVLADMNRLHTVGEFEDIVSRFREEIPEISLSTDIIVGYPTETSQAFQDTINIVKRVKPDFLHISKYHHRPGSHSSKLNEIDHQAMKERSRELNELKTKITLNNNQKLSDKTLEVLVTGKGSKGGFIGRTDSYKTVIVNEASLGSFVNVKITEVKGTYLLGQRI